MENIEKPFEFFDVTADVGFVAYGKTMEESFENSGLAMFNVISNTDNISKSKELQFTISSEDEVSLLYDFLEELLFLHEVEFMLFSDFDVEISKEKDEYILDATVRGEEINWEIHERGCEVKAVTFHLMDVHEEDGIHKTKAILDL
ncbi:MAG: archease [Methanobrevibacter sp.]|uniref:archease n=1 Tax=Methanobrevibacter sp. TaxID=66852 RepID=UPI0026DF06B0|nr:archease [Methanobrevibacter sp.]MDO5848490.1 archease [Methanobrevibacter sp.]